ncbi:hypothetical protein F5B22DRAFT_645592 [Xylaria bambusicola]|uniref:uncharacterized protein n=1 Tax=Xylaria bambusicola TaxID=326684 RepID=UPI0020086320|nr:uncharacterized protein F5B22DRAFT_645592 [Xylaria bambusicola]KAI0517886.1 hypothetical protein F5B22DRAFT_645592 [Xylaria bambusicola]
MVCQTRSQARQQAEKRDTRQTQQDGNTTPDIVYPRTVRVAARSPKGRGRKRAPKQTKKRNQAPRVPPSFNHLPTEIRVMIWEEYVRTPRIIRIDVLKETPTKAEQGYVVRFRADEYQGKSEQVCPLVGVNRESRYVALHAMKESLIHFTVSCNIEKPKRFQPTSSIRRNFSIRSHDVVFFENSGSSTFRRMWLYGDTPRITNVMVDLDVSDINYMSNDAIPQWEDMFEMAQHLTKELKNKEHLQNIYCLMRNDKTLLYGIDSVQELTPERLYLFPKEREGDLLQWLQEFDIFLQAVDHGTIRLFYAQDFNAVRTVWKNVMPTTGSTDGSQGPSSIART